MSNNMKTLHRFLEWLDDFNESTLGSIIAWLLFVGDFAVIWLFAYMIAG